MHCEFKLRYFAALLVLVLLPFSSSYTQTGHNMPGRNIPEKSEAHSAYLHPAPTASFEKLDRDRLECWSPYMQPSFSELIASMPEEKPGVDSPALSAKPTCPDNTKDTKSWTYLFYDDADFYNGYDPLIDFSNEAYSGDNLNVLVLQDSVSDSAYLWYVNSDHSLTLLEDLGEINMGEPATVQYLVDYGKLNYPAERYLLAMYDHGGGWKGACVDITNNGWLSMNDIQTALDQSKGVDILSFTAPCLMGAFESVYEMSDLVDVYIGSEELSGFIMWWGVIGPVCDLLNDSASLTTYEVGQEIIRLVDECALYPQYKHDLTMSAVRVDKAGELAACLDTLCQHLNATPGRYINSLWSARQEAHEFGLTNPEDFGVIDLLDFVHEYAALETDPVILNDLGAIEAAFAEAVLAECHGSNMEDTFGLSIYYPREENLYDPTYVTTLLDFPADTDWDLYLNEYFDATGAIEHVYVDDDAPASWYDLSHVKTIGEALDRVKEGGTVHVSCGVYNESIHVSKGVNVIGEDRELTLIRTPMPYPVRITADNVLITGLTIENTGSNSVANLYISYADNVTATGNIIMVSNFNGVWLSSSTGCTITHNIIRDCNCGANLNSLSSGNTLYGNIFQNNTTHALDQGANNWDQGDVTGGNFWDDYAGVDMDKDGIGDTPYVISGVGNEDGFPLIFPYYGLSVDAHTLSAAIGGELNFTLHPGLSATNRKFILLGSATGTAPGLSLPLGMVTLPLNQDVFMDVIIGNLNTPLFVNFLGELDMTGMAQATLNTFGPIPPGSVGTRIFFAYALYSVCDFVSNPVIVEIVN